MELEPWCAESCALPAEVRCSGPCRAPLCRNHAHVASKDEVYCYDCLARLGAVE